MPFGIFIQDSLISCLWDFYPRWPRDPRVATVQGLAITQGLAVLPIPETPFQLFANAGPGPGRRINLRFLTIASIAKKSRTLWLFLVQACPRLVVCLRLQCLRQSQFHYLLPALFAKGLLGGWHTMGGSRAEARPPHKFKRFLPPHKFKRFLTIGNSEYCKQNQVKIGGSRVAAEGGGVCRGPPIFLRCIFVASLRLLWHGCVLLPGGKYHHRHHHHHPQPFRLKPFGLKRLLLISRIFHLLGSMDDLTTNTS